QKEIREADAQRGRVKVEPSSATTLRMGIREGVRRPLTETGRRPDEWNREAIHTLLPSDGGKC
ncbi:hypothetical protein SK128_026742, partial [Halocaridina rubra]